MDKCNVSISSDLVKDIIDVKMREAMVEALGKDPEALVTAVVKSALEKKESSYGRGKTVFQEAIDKMIQEEARAVFQKWLSAKKPLIKKAILKRLKDTEAGFVDTVAEKLVDTLGSKFYVSVHLKVED